MTLFRISPTSGPPQIPGRPSPAAQGGSGSPLGPRGAACRVSLPGRAGERREGAGRRASQIGGQAKGEAFKSCDTSLSVKEDELEDADCIFPSSIPWFMGAALIRFSIA